MRAAPPAAALLLLLAGCDPAPGRHAAARDDAVHITAADGADGNHVSVSIPGFDAKVALPGIDLGRHVDMDGIRLAPGTAVKGVDVTDHDGAEGGGQVRIAFTSAQAPDALLRWYGDQAAKAGYGAVNGSAGALSASKGDKRFALTVAPQSGGSAGTITITGS